MTAAILAVPTGLGAGLLDGAFLLGWGDGVDDGPELGCADGWALGSWDGTSLGWRDGFDDGPELSCADGWALSSWDGASLGWQDGVDDSVDHGCKLGCADG